MRTLTFLNILQMRQKRWIDEELYIRPQRYYALSLFRENDEDIINIQGWRLDFGWIYLGSVEK